MATSPDLQEPLITAARAQAWHQTGDAVLTLEAARSWLNDVGMLLFAPRGGSLGAPAPSLVEATLGTPKEATTPQDAETARRLVARLVGEGSALPLNLLGSTGDLPDFVISAQAFPFVFTLRGDKGWKRPPETSGAVKVTPLGLRVYELIAEKGSLTVSEIVSEAGREVTESAVVRALSELWQMLRVLPVLQQGEGDTRWELTTTRFLKAIKSGANAGQPTALSALISFYLRQVYVATEEEIAAFLSPLTARSRVREVVHGLIAGRQLTEGVVNGKTVLYIPDALPDFAAFAPEQEGGEENEGETETSAEPVEGEGDQETPRERIRSFGPTGGRTQDRNLRGKPLGRGKSGGFSSDTRRPSRPGFSRGAGASNERSRGDRGAFRPRTGRPFGQGEDAGTGAARSERRGGDFSRPWEEERANRPRREERSQAGADEGASRPPRFDRGTREPRGDRPFSRAGEGQSRPPRRSDDGPARPSFRRAEGGDDRGFRSRPPRGDRPQKPFRERSAEDRPFRPRPEGDRPFRPRTEGEARPFRPRKEGGDRPFRPGAESGDRPFRARPEGGDRPFRPRLESGDRPFRPRPEGGERPPRRRTDAGAPRPPRSRSEGGDRPLRSEQGESRERRGPDRGSSRFSGGPEGRSERSRSTGPRFRGAEGGETGAPRSRSSADGSGRGREGRSPGGTGRPQGRPGARGGARPPAKRAGGKPPSRPDRAPRRPRPEDEA